MSFLLDTNVVSEWTKASPNEGVAMWLSAADEDRIHISAATLGELRYGIERLPSGQRRDLLERWLMYDLRLRFQERIVAVTEEVFDRWGVELRKSELQGRRLSVLDALIAATALVHELRLVTRNTRHFAEVVPDILNPWT